jgi:hypothetical protein
MVFARERLMTPREFGRLKARLKRQGLVVPAAPPGEAREAQRRGATRVDYLLSEYSVRARRVRDIALLTGGFA